MRDRVEKVIAVCAVNAVEADVRVVNADVAAFADEVFEHRDHGAFAQIVRIFLESQSQHADPSCGRIQNRVHRTLQLRLKKARASPFVEIRDAVRSDLASKYLQHSNLSVVQIAEMLD